MMHFYPNGVTYSVTARPPITPPPPTVTTIVKTKVNLNRTITLEPHFVYEGFSYNRYQKQLTVTTPTFNIKFNNMNYNGGARVVLQHPTYKLFIDGVVVSTVSVTVGVSNSATFTNVTTPADGWHVAYVRAFDSSGNQVLTYHEKGAAATSNDEAFAPYVFWADVGGTAKDSLDYVVQNGSYIWTHGTNWSFYTILKKAGLTHAGTPLPLRETVTPFNTALAGNQLARTQLIMNTDAIDQDRHHVQVTNRGILVTENLQGYFPNQMFDVYPKLPLLDGPRGVCTAPMTLVATPGRLGKWYNHTPWSFYVVDSTGYKRTLVGLKNNGFPKYWENPPTTVTDPSLTIVGDWDPSIPLEKRYPLESWGFGWDPRSLLLDNNAAPIGGEQPHLPYTIPGRTIIGPRGFATCRHGRVLEYEFNGSNRAAPCKVREWITGLNDPWGLAVTPQNTIIVGERGSHRISEWSMDVPNTKIRDILHAPGATAAGSVQPIPNRRFIGSTTTARSFTVCAPEGLALMDDWLYYGSMAQGEVRRVNLVTGVVENGKAYPTMNTSSVGSYYVNVAVSDGSFGPRHTIFTTTFYNSNHGHPQAFLPTGATWTYLQYGYGMGSGRGDTYNGGHYPTAVGCGPHGMVCADSGGGFDVFTKADSYDTTYNLGAVQRGWEYYRAQGYSVVHGPYTVNRNSVALPWGENVDMDVWLRNCGNTP